MKLLLDTHAFLWFILDDSHLSNTASALICDPSNQIFVSPATHWEIAIKIGLGKYQLPEPFDTFMTRQIEANRFEILPVEIRHTARLIGLPFYHRDPFDRLLAAQTLADQLALVSRDEIFDAYGVLRLW